MPMEPTEPTEPMEPMERLIERGRSSQEVDMNNMASTSGSSSSSINWDLCCLCQLDAEEPLQKPTKEGLVSLERHLKDFIAIANVLPSCVNVTIDQLNDGSGIAATLMSHNAKYQKRCRSY